MLTKSIILYVLVLFWMIFIFYMSSEVSNTSSQRSDAIAQVIRGMGISLPQDTLTFLTRKAAHIFAYLVLGLLIFNAFKDSGWKINRVILLSIALCCLYAISDEVHQTFVAGRSGEVRDVVIDTAASATGVGLYYGLQRSWCENKKFKVTNRSC